MLCVGTHRTRRGVCPRSEVVRACVCGVPEMSRDPRRRRTSRRGFHISCVLALSSVTQHAVHHSDLGPLAHIKRSTRSLARARHTSSFIHLTRHTHHTFRVQPRPQRVTRSRSLGLGHSVGTTMCKSLSLARSLGLGPSACMRCCGGAIASDRCVIVLRICRARVGLACVARVGLISHVARLRSHKGAGPAVRPMVRFYSSYSSVGGVGGTEHGRCPPAQSRHLVLVEVQLVVVR